MQPAKKPPPNDPAAESKPPLRQRLHAWWHGYDPSALEPVTSPPPEQRAPSPDNDPEAASEIPPISAQEAQRKLIQLVFGPGFSYPGGEELTTELFQAFGLDSTSSMIEIGAGLGGSTRAIARQSGAYVTAWELDPDYAKEATLQAEVHDLERQASVHALDPEKFEFKKNFYSGALIHESLFRFEDKKALLDEVVASMKANAQIVIYDLFFDDSASSRPFVEWLEGEGTPRYPMSIDEARQCLGDLSVDIRGATDDSDRYRSVALKAWAEFVGRVADQPVGNDLVIPMVREVERWARRSAAIDTGELQIFKIVGMKRAEVR